MTLLVDDFNLPAFSPLDASKWNVNNSGTATGADQFPRIDIDGAACILGPWSSLAGYAQPLLDLPEDGFELTHEFWRAGSSTLNINHFIWWRYDAKSSSATAPQNGYSLQRGSGNNTMTVRKHINGAATTVFHSTAWSAVAPQATHRMLKLRVEGARIRVKEWNAADPEPETWSGGGTVGVCDVTETTNAHLPLNVQFAAQGNNSALYEQKIDNVTLDNFAVDASPVQNPPGISKILQGAEYVDGRPRWFSNGKWRPGAVKVNGVWREL